MDMFKKYTSNTLCGTSNNFMLTGEVERFTCRAFVKPYEYGDFTWRFWFSNACDSTYAEGSVSYANRPGGRWRIISASVADGGDTVGGPTSAETPVTFGGEPGREVAPGEKFWSDEVQLSVAEGNYLVWTWTLEGNGIPCTPDSQIPCFRADGEGWREDKIIPKPNLLACDRGERTRLVFIGDSITQGCGTGFDKYDFWAAEISKRLDRKHWAVWNTGLGFGRAYDAVTDGAWLYRAKTAGDVVIVCFGVNDTARGRSADDLWRDLRRISRTLRASGAKVILFTIPPFDFTGDRESRWREVNRRIREADKTVADGVFDLAAVLGHPAPEDNRALYGGHPDGNGGRAAAEEFIRQDILGKL